ncbi:hypothetical protein BH09VER1_BH09VER1_31950 [soil metagenome]
MRDEPSTLKMKLSTLGLWIPFIYSVVICGLVVGPYLISIGKSPTGAWEMGFPAFFCFLPLVFLFVTIGTSNKLSLLETRIRQLEKLNGGPLKQQAE